MNNPRSYHPASRSRLRLRARAAAGVAAVTLGVVAFGTPALAVVSETGSINCSPNISYLHSRTKGRTEHYPAGVSWYRAYSGDSTWRVRETNGGPSGSWGAYASIDMDHPQTYSQCRPYG